MAKLWSSRAPRERLVVAVLAVIVGVALYLALVQSATRAHQRLTPAVASLRAQAALLEQQAAEFERLRNLPAAPAGESDLRTVVQGQVGAAGLARALVRIDAPNPDQVQVGFGAMPFTDWLALVSSLQQQRVRLENCRIEAASTPGVVSVTATFSRAKP